jgi:hypothetical protein
MVELSKIGLELSSRPAGAKMAPEILPNSGVKKLYTLARRSVVISSHFAACLALTADGSLREMLCAYHRHLLPPRPGFNDPGAPLAEAMLPFAIVDTGDHKTKDLDALCHSPNPTRVMGKFERDLADADGSATPESGKMYRVLNLMAESLSECFYVESVAKKEFGQTEVTLQNRWHTHSEAITLNPDYDGCDGHSKVFGKCCVWVPVKFETETHGDYKSHQVDETLDLGDAHALNHLIYEHGFAKAAVQKHKDEYMVRLHAEQSNTPGAFLSKLATKAALMTHCALDEATADEVLKLADERSRYLFLYEPAEKKAHNLRFPQFPEFYDTMNSDYNVQEQPQPSRIMVQAERDIPYIEKHRIGDQMRFDAPDNADNTGGSNSSDGSSGSDNGSGIDTATPMDLYGLSQQRGVGSLFEHGVVGALTNTYDSAALIDTYMPDLQTALDRIGRVLFLFYWKPEDFATAFGSDDQSQLENKLVSNFKSFGDLVMELLQKNKPNNPGSVSLT